jgi:regulatory protein
VPADAFDAVVGALARRDLTTSELDTRLERAGFDSEERALALARAAAAGYLDDARVALERARLLAERGAADATIRGELERRGVDDGMIAQALHSLPGEAERARLLAAKLGGGPRAARALARKGYPEEVIAHAVRLQIAEEL